MKLYLHKKNIKRPKRQQHKGVVSEPALETQRTYAGSASNNNTKYQFVPPIANLTSITYPIVALNSFLHNLIWQGTFPA